MRPTSAAPRDPFSRIAPYYDALMASVPYSWWADYVSRLAALSGNLIRPGSRLLDLATGTGSVGLEFARRGSAVTGVDLSEAMLAQARRKAAERGLDVTLLCRDLRDLDLPPVFDHAVCLYDSLNYILDCKGLKQAFASARAALREGGLLIFDVNTVRALEAELFTQSSPDGAEVRYRWVSKYDPKTRISTIRMRFEVPAKRDRFTALHRQRAYTDSELTSSLRDAGFADVREYDGYSVSPPDASSDRVFYVARASAEPEG